MKKYTLLSLSVSVILICIEFSLFAQLSIPGTPYGLDQNRIQHLQILPQTDIPATDLKQLKAEDEVMDHIAGAPFRFGENIYVDLHPGNSGVWDTMPDGTRIWRLALQSKGAVSLNLAFDRFRLPEGARLFVYTPDGKNIIGAFSHLNNQPDGYFATTLLPGDAVVVEYREPARVSFSAELSLWRVTHGYRGPGKLLDKAFGDSGNCNLNVACEESEGWEDQIRSVGMIVTGGNGFCTGALINNTENDATPYFLSADHCYRDAATLVFWFNWQSDTCEDPDEIPPHDALSGAVTRARFNSTDFWLLELNQSLPEEYDVYFAGWNRNLDEQISGTMAGIHHPRGDIKKFSWAEGGVSASAYLKDPGTGITHWRIGPWSGGTTTEPGSSGSPLFDYQGRIIGQLHGGYAACGNTEPDWYGRFGISWTGNGTPETRLSDWLDPEGKNPVDLFGFDPVRDAADPDAPAMVEDFIVIADALGELRVVLSWTNPLLTFGGDELTTIDSVKIYRQNERIYTITDSEPGEELSFTDSVLTVPGIYTYEVKASNAAGNGPSARFTVYVGQDKPGAVRNITLVNSDNNGLLEWDAPTTGLNDGFFDPASITHYQITRNPNGQNFTVNYPNHILIDSTITQPGVYSYTITAVNDIGAGAPTVSPFAMLAAGDTVFMHSGEVIACSGRFFDSGGPDASYQNNEDYVLTFTPDIIGARMEMMFDSFSVEAGWDFLYVYDGDSTEEELLLGQFSGDAVPEKLEYLVSSHPSGALTFHFQSDASVVRPGWEASVSCFYPTDADLAAHSLQGNITPSVEAESVFVVSIENIGSMLQQGSNYSVELRNTAGQLLAEIQGEDVLPSENLELEISWTPQEAGSMGVMAIVNLPDDTNPSNDTTAILELQVMPEGVIAFTVGQQKELPSFRVPFDFSYNNSLAQTLYFEDELELQDSLITGLAYFNSFDNELKDQHVMIFAGVTHQMDLSDGFIDPTELTLVYEGKHNFPAGDNHVHIAFQQPFDYTGGNLVLMTHKTMYPYQGSAADKFYASPTLERPSRIRNAISDAETYDPENPPSGGLLYDYVPVTTFFLGFSNMGSFEGFVKDEEGNAIMGASVSLREGVLETQSDAEGFFRIEHLVPGSYSALFAKEGFVESILDIEIEPVLTTFLEVELERINPIEETTAYDITIFPNPAVAFVKISSGSLIKRVRLVDLNGRVLMNQNAGTPEVILDLKSVDSGVYILQIWTEAGGWFHKRLVVK